MNECTLNTHNCDSRSERRTCTNTPGSFTCGCLSGYQLAGDRRTCNGKVMFCKQEQIESLPNNKRATYYFTLMLFFLKFIYFLGFIEFDHMPDSYDYPMKVKK